MRLSIIVELANTVLNGDDRVFLLLEQLGGQWRDLVAGVFPDDLGVEERRVLARLAPRVELLLVSPEPGYQAPAALLARVPDGFDVTVHVAPGLEYYGLKNSGGAQARGDLLVFIDCDVVPDAGWMAHLLGTFARPEVQVACGHTYIGPVDLVSRAFALGWTYRLRDDSLPSLSTPEKFYANNLAFRAAVFRETPFPPIGHRSRGAGSLLRARLAERGLAVWENARARVSHPPPAGVRHAALHGIAVGRDHYLKVADARSWPAVKQGLALAGKRLGVGFGRARSHWRPLGLRRREIPAALSIVVGYYAMFAAGVLMTYASPDVMARRFRI